MPHARIEFDEHGFLQDPSVWNEELAARIAAALGIADLTEQHLAVLAAFRRYYQVQRAIPSTSRLCQELGLGEACVEMLFGGALYAWRVAGLPDPGEAARISLASQTVTNSETTDG